MITIDKQTGVITVDTQNEKEEEVLLGRVNLTVELNELSCTAEADIVQHAADAKYLLVTPTAIQWITPDYGVDYDVKSNTDWEVEASQETIYFGQH